MISVWEENGYRIECDAEKIMSILKELNENELLFDKKGTIISIIAAIFLLIPFILLAIYGDQAAGLLITPICWVIELILIISVKVKYPKNVIGKYIYNVTIGLIIFAIFTGVLLYAMERIAIGIFDSCCGR